MEFMAKGSYNIIHETTNANQFSNMQVQQNCIQQTQQQTTQLTQPINNVTITYPQNVVVQQQPYQFVGLQTNRTHYNMPNNCVDIQGQVFNSMQTHESNNHRINNFDDNSKSMNHRPVTSLKRNDSNSLSAKLKDYASYLDDHESFRQERLQKNAMRRYSQIMQLVKTRYRDYFQIDDDDEDDIDDDWCPRSNNSLAKPRPADIKMQPDFNKSHEFPCFNKILRRHRDRLLGQHIKTDQSVLYHLNSTSLSDSLSGNGLL